MAFKKLLYLFYFLLLVYSCNSHAKTDGSGSKDAPPSNKPSKPSKLDLIKLPPGFKISFFAENVKGARSMARGTNGTIFVGTREKSVYALVDMDHDGVVDAVYTIAD